MNSNYSDVLLRISVALKNISATELAAQLAGYLAAALKHLVQAVLVVGVGAVVYVLTEPSVDTAIAVAIALVAMVAAVKFFYFSVATGTVASATMATGQLQQHSESDLDDIDPINKHEISNIWH